MPDNHFIDIDFTCDGAVVRVELHSGDESKDVAIVPPGRIGWHRPIERVTLAAPGGGFWSMVYEAPGKWIRHPLVALPTGPSGWWHSVHIPTSAAKYYRPLRIGVVDESLSRQDSSSPLAHVINLGGSAWANPGEEERAYASLGWDHGYIVCSLLTARPVEPTGFIGTAPHQTRVYFMAAGRDDTWDLHSGRVINAIDMLAHDYRCDIITMSAGSTEFPPEDIRAAIADANRAGTLCFVAAGNDGGSPGYPACYAECLAVGAVGQKGWAPPRSWGELQEHNSPEIEGDLFLWYHSSAGMSVEFLGAGVSVCCVLPNGNNWAVTGTSYASPIVAGTAARILSADEHFCAMQRDNRRVTYAVDLLRRAAFNPFPAASKYGIIQA